MRVRMLALALLLALSGVLASPAAAQGPVVTLDDQLVELAERIEGFGGLFVDENGRLNVFLENFNQAAPFRAIDPDVQLHPAQFDFAELQEWRVNARSTVLGRDAAVFVDVDETQNRVRIGVDRSAGPKAAAGLLRTLEAAGVPSDAVVIEPTDPIFPVATLQDRIRPVPGGMQIRFSSFLCTLGFNAFRDGVSGFVTNSHCTDRQGRNSGTEYFQPLDQVANQFIGTEQADPSYFRNQNGCPRGSQCRFSDSAWASYDSASLSAGDEIARPDGTNNGSLTIDSNTPRFPISAKDTGGNQLVGTVVNKVGRTTGWTFGDVDGSCVDVNVAQSNITLLCQTIVNAGVGGGDSGSPVFAWDGSSDVTLSGILWGGNSAGTLFVFSPLSAIEQELGALTTH